MDRCIGQQSLELAPGDTKAEPHELALQIALVWMTR